MTYVDTIDGSAATRTKVTVGQTYGAFTEITAGLVEGDQVQVTVAAVGRTGTGTGTGAGATGTGDRPQRPEGAPGGNQ